MNNLCKRFLIALLMMGASSTAWAQARWVKLETNQIDSFVYADSTWLGTAERSVFQIPASTEKLILVPRSADVWSVPAISQRLEESELDTLTVKLNFPYYYRLETVPSGVDIYQTDGTIRSHLGTSPLDYVSDTPLQGELIFDRPGYVTRRVEPGDEIWNRHLVLLESVEQMDPLLRTGIRGSTQNLKWIDYVAVGTTVVGGLLAIHYKTKADRLYDQYAETRDRALKPDVEQFDLYSGIALGAMQVGLGVLAFRLIF